VRAFSINKICALWAITTLIMGLITLFLPRAAVFAIDSDAASTTQVEILAFGDSLTAGYGLPVGEGFTDQLQVWLNDHMDIAVKVVNGGVSGDTSSGGRSRLEWGLAPIKGGRPDLVILELGANDALRGVQPALTRENIDAMLATLTTKNIPVLLTGMLATPSWGSEYGEAFNSIFPDMAAKYGVPLYPFFLEGVATDQSLNQADGLHPTKEGVAVIVNKIGPQIVELLSR